MIEEPSDYELLESIIPRKASTEWEDLLTRYASQSPKTGPRNHFEEQVDSYLKYMLWDPATFDSDRSRFWMSAYQYDRTHPSGSLIRILEWAKKLDCLHVGQVIKVLRKKSTK